MISLYKEFFMDVDDSYRAINVMEFPIMELYRVRDNYSPDHGLE